MRPVLRLTFASFISWLRYLYLLLFDFPLTCFFRGYGRAGKLSSWRTIRAKALDYWGMLWNILGWFCGALLPGELLGDVFVGLTIMIVYASIALGLVWVGLFLVWLIGSSLWAIVHF